MYRTVLPPKPLNFFRESRADPKCVRDALHQTGTSIDGGKRPRTSNQVARSVSRSRCCAAPLQNQVKVLLHRFPFLLRSVFYRAYAGFLDELGSRGAQIAFVWLRFIPDVLSSRLCNFSESLISPAPGSSPKCLIGVRVGHFDVRREGNCRTHESRNTETRRKRVRWAIPYSIVRQSPSRFFSKP